MSSFCCNSWTLYFLSWRYRSQEMLQEYLLCDFQCCPSILHDSKSEFRLISQMCDYYRNYSTNIRNHSGINDADITMDYKQLLMHILSLFTRGKPQNPLGNSKTRQKFSQSLQFCTLELYLPHKQPSVKATCHQVQTCSMRLMTGSQRLLLR